jgi:hypothetical protein
LGDVTVKFIQFQFDLPDQVITAQAVMFGLRKRSLDLVERKAERLRLQDHG